MAELNATPGPWRVHFEEAVRVKGPTGTVAIATNTPLGARIDPSEVAANAHLIASAPCMIDRLQETQKLLAILLADARIGAETDDYWFDAVERITEAMEANREVLARARGEA